MKFIYYVIPILAFLFDMFLFKGPICSTLFLFSLLFIIIMKIIKKQKLKHIATKLFIYLFIVIIIVVIGDNLNNKVKQQAEHLFIEKSKTLINKFETSIYNCSIIIQKTKNETYMRVMLYNFKIGTFRNNEWIEEQMHD